MLARPGALSIIIADTGSGLPTAALYAASRFVRAKTPPLEKRWTWTGVGEARRASTTGFMRACRDCVVEGSRKSLLEVVVKIMRAVGARRLYCARYFVYARTGAFIQKARRMVLVGGVVEWASSLLEMGSQR